MIKHLKAKTNKDSSNLEYSYPELMFFLKTAGKTRFMLSMSKKLQVLGLEKLFLQEPRNFCYFFIMFLIRDTILYILIPIVTVYFIEL